MPELLHGWALAPAAIGTCCLAADRGRARAPELAASVLMLLAMLDASGASPVLAPVAWAGILLLTAMALAVARRSRRTGAVARHRTRSSESGPPMLAEGRVMQVLTTTGLILMACLLLLGMPHDAPGGGHSHGGVGGGVLLVGAAVMSAAYVLASTLSVVRVRPWRDRAQIAAMGVSALLMSIAALG